MGVLPHLKSKNNTSGAENKNTFESANYNKKLIKKLQDYLNDPITKLQMADYYDEDLRETWGKIHNYKILLTII